MADALGGIGPAAIPALTTALKDDDPWVRWTAAGALRGIGPAANTALKDDDAEVRQTMADALGGIGPRAKDVGPPTET